MNIKTTIFGAITALSISCVAATALAATYTPLKIPVTITDNIGANSSVSFSYHPESYCHAKPNSGTVVSGNPGTSTVTCSKFAQGEFYFEDGSGKPIGHVEVGAGTCNVTTQDTPYAISASFNNKCNIVII